MNEWAGYHVLVVEDDMTLREVLRDFLRSSQAQVFTAANGQQAVPLIETEKIHLVLSDLQMPLMDGLKLLEYIRMRDSMSPDVILFTGDSQLTEERALAAGAVGLIEKPFRMRDLAQIINILRENLKMKRG